ncbi:unnamed protein product, partial [Heterosigma akashiwo]
MQDKVTQRSAKAFMTRWLQKGSIPTRPELSSLLDACANAGAMMEKWFGKMQAAGVRPNEVTYTTLLKGHARQGNTAKYPDLHDHMVPEGVYPKL